MIVLPTEAPADGEFAWLSFEGHWGERRPMFNDGPTGPAMKDQWNAPLDWIEEEGRDGAVALPFGGSPATDAFCDISRTRRRRCCSSSTIPCASRRVRLRVVRWSPSSATRRVDCSGCGARVSPPSRAASCRSAARPVRRRFRPCRALARAAPHIDRRCPRRPRRRFALGCAVPRRDRGTRPLPVMAWVFAATVELVIDADRPATAARVPGGCQGCVRHVRRALSSSSWRSARHDRAPAPAPGRVVAGRWLSPRWRVPTRWCQRGQVYVAVLSCSVGAGCGRSASRLHAGPRAHRAEHRRRAAPGADERQLRRRQRDRHAVRGGAVPYVALVLVHFYVELTESGTAAGIGRRARRRRRHGSGCRERGT